MLRESPAEFWSLLRDLRQECIVFKIELLEVRFVQRVFLYSFTMQNPSFCSPRCRYVILFCFRLSRFDFVVFVCRTKQSLQRQYILPWVPLVGRYLLVRSFELDFRGMLLAHKFSINDNNKHESRNFEFIFIVHSAIDASFHHICTRKLLKLAIQFQSCTFVF